MGSEMIREWNERIAKIGTHTCNGIETCDICFLLKQIDSYVATMEVMQEPDTVRVIHEAEIEMTYARAREQAARICEEKDETYGDVLAERIRAMQPSDSEGVEAKPEQPEPAATQEPPKEEKP